MRRSKADASTARLARIRTTWIFFLEGYFNVFIWKVVITVHVHFCTRQFFLDRARNCRWRSRILFRVVVNPWLDHVDGSRRSSCLSMHHDGLARGWRTPLSLPQYFLSADTFCLTCFWLERPIRTGLTQIFNLVGVYWTFLYNEYIND